MWKRVLNCKASDRIERIDWPSMSFDLASIEDISQLVKIRLRKKNDSLSIFDLLSKAGIEAFGSRLGYYTYT